MNIPQRQIRAAFTDEAIIVYQAYEPVIAAPAVASQSFVPPFKGERMTWIKPSFLWMMYRCGWATKPGRDQGLGRRHHARRVRMGAGALLPQPSRVRYRPGGMERRLRDSAVRFSGTLNVTRTTMPCPTAPSRWACLATPSPVTSTNRS